jgi:lactoylglutathione lyase
MARLSYAIVFTSDMQRGSAFYRETFDLRLRFESPEWSELETGEVTLALHHAAPGEGAPAQGGPPTAGRCQLGFHVDNIEGFHQQMLAKGVPCLRKPTEEFGVILAVYTDPDGLPFSVSQKRQ